jgi:peptidoglycan hydrolase-like protein with peptidoglycan-binding domain
LVAAAAAGQAVGGKHCYDDQPARLANNEMSPDMIRKVQQHLKDGGLNSARVDGVWGPQTGAARRDYQHQHNINAAGETDQQTLNAMNIPTRATLRPRTIRPADSSSRTTRNPTTIAAAKLQSAATEQQRWTNNSNNANATR